MTFVDYCKLYKRYENPPSTLFHKYVNKKIGFLCGYLCVKVGISPNTITILSTLTLWSVFLLDPTITIINLIIFVLLTQISYSLDCIDGVVARINKKGSKYGAFLDLSLDRFNLIVFWLYLITILPNEFNYIGIIAAVLHNFYCVICIIKEPLYPELKNYVKSQEDKSIKIKLIKFFYEFIDTGSFYFMISIGILFESLHIIMIMYIAIYGLMILAMYVLLYNKK